MRQPLVFVVTTPFSVNAFLRTHLLVLAKTYDITLCVNTTAYPLVEEVARVVRVKHIDIARKVVFFQDALAFFQLLRCFIEIRPVAVHSMTPKAGLLAMLAARLVGVSYRFHTFTGQVWANRTGIIRSLMKLTDGIIAMCASQVFADSASQCRVLEREGIVRPGDVMVLGYGSVAGVDLSRFHPNAVVRKEMRDELGLAEDSLVFIFVGRLVRDKGVFDLVEAFSHIGAQHPSWELWVIGPDEDHLKAAMQADGVRLGSRIRWFDPTLVPERYMVAADILVLPSYREGFGSVIIEAAACGLPCIAYKIDGVTDAIVEKQTGLFAAMGDINGLSRRMKYLGLETEVRERMGDAAHKRAVSEFSSSRVSAAWQSFYSTTLNRTRY